MQRTSGVVCAKEKAGEHLTSFRAGLGPRSCAPFSIWQCCGAQTAGECHANGQKRREEGRAVISTPGGWPVLCPPACLGRRAAQRRKESDARGGEQALVGFSSIPPFRCLLLGLLLSLHEAGRVYGSRCSHASRYGLGPNFNKKKGARVETFKTT